MKRDRCAVVENSKIVGNGNMQIKVHYVLPRCSLFKLKRALFDSVWKIIEYEKSMDKKLRKELPNR